MMQPNISPINQDLVLIGGGHSHAIALRLWGMRPLPGVRVTLISDASDTPYSGMIPGYVAGFYERDDCYIDLRRLAQFAQAQLVIDRVVGLDLEQRQVLCAQRPPIAFDLLSIDIGSTPALPQFAATLDTSAYSIPVKPIRQFLARWHQVVEQVRQQPHQPLSIGVVGGGVAGVETILAMQRHLDHVLGPESESADQLTWHLFHQGSELMPQNNPFVRRQLTHLLADRGIQLHLKEQVQTIDDHQVICASGLRLTCDYLFWMTQASAPDWLRQAGLDVDEKGFIQIQNTLQSRSHPFVFATGDIATIVNQPRPKAGVFAVRQGKPLYENLQRSLRHQPLKPYRPQRQYLSLIGTSELGGNLPDNQAIAAWGPLGWGPANFLWRWKDQIDRRFMDQFHGLPQMPQEGMKPGLIPESNPLPARYCAGCGAKVGSSTLERVLSRIHREQAPPPHREDVLIGLNQADDAAVVRVPADRVLVQTVDYFRSLVADPFQFGQIAANHALSDLFAMGATPQSALAIATIPYGRTRQTEATLYQLLSGAVTVLHRAGAVLIGGHTTEGAELAFGLTCNGLAAPDQLLRKGGMQAGDRLILTKPLGTGTLFAAQMQGRAKNRWIDGAIEMMLQSNQDAATCLIEHGATACTDITGFGLIGHLREMVRAAQIPVVLDLEALPLLEGALATTELGIFSSLQPQNLQAAQAIADCDRLQPHPVYPLLFDPQTSGGLLAAVPAEQADACVAALRDLGYWHSAIVGQVVSKISQPTEANRDQNRQPEGQTVPDEHPGILRLQVL